MIIKQLNDSLTLFLKKEPSGIKSYLGANLLSENQREYINLWIKFCEDERETKEGITKKGIIILDINALSYKNAALLQKKIELFLKDQNNFFLAGYQDVPKEIEGIFTRRLNVSFDNLI